MKKKIFSSLQHPLLLLVVGGIITGLLLPSITTQWQNRQKELELKTDLVSEISDAVASLTAKTQVYKVNPGMSSTEWTDAYENWVSSNAIIGSKLRAYFSNSALPPLWRNYSLILTDFGFLSIRGECDTSKYVKEIQKYFGIDPKLTNKSETIIPNLTNKSETNNCPNSKGDSLQEIRRTPFASDLQTVDWDYLAEHRSDRFLSDDWQKLKENMMTQKDRIIQEILNSKVQIFSSYGYFWR